MKRRSTPPAGSGRTLLSAALLAASCFGIFGLVFSGHAEAGVPVSVQDGSKQKGGDAKKQKDATADKNAEAAKKEALKKEALKKESLKKESLKKAKLQKQEAMKQEAQETEARRREEAKKRSARSRLGRKTAPPKSAKVPRGTAAPRKPDAAKVPAGQKVEKPVFGPDLSAEKKRALQKEYEEKSRASAKTQAGK
ncbi:MAG: hypothetical protein VX460_04445, partial [Planctomycetota bacterium]|nr:hypothetical protein [Planctomycetota bacterium]